MAQAIQAGQAVQVTEAQVVEVAEVEGGEEAVAPQRISRFTPPTGVSLGACLCGIRIRLHWSMFVIVILSLITSLIRRDSFTIVFFSFLLDGPILFLTVLIHEIGHALVTRRLGGEVTDLVLWPGGGLTVTGPNDGSLADDLKAAVAGPLMHIPMGVFWFLIVLLCHRTTDLDLDNADSITDSPSVFFWKLASYALRINVLIFLANVIIPIYPFDAGRIFANFFMMIGLSISNAVKITAALGIIVGLATLVLALIFSGNVNRLVEVLFGLVIVLMSVSLFSKVNVGTLRRDIIFGRSCYDRHHDADGGTEQSSPESSSQNGDPAVPAVNEIV